MDIIYIPRKEIKLEDKPIQVELFKGKLWRIEFVKDNKKYYCNLKLGGGGLTWGIYATGDYGAPFIEDPKDAEVFFSELENLPEEDKEKYKELIALIPKQYELCRKYLKREIGEEEIDRANGIIEKYNKELSNDSEKLMKLYEKSGVRPKDLEGIMNDFAGGKDDFSNNINCNGHIR